MSTTQQQYDETTGLPVHPREAADTPATATATAFQYHDGPDPLDGVEGVDWEWEEQDKTPEEPEVDTHDFAALHSCNPALPHHGYGHAASSCIEDRFGRLWLFDSSGRRGTQAKFCPFCGFQALDATPPDKPMRIVANDIALTPADGPQRVWVQNKQRVMMRHFQFGSVRVLASDGCHAKVITLSNVQMTVCVENLEQIRGERCLPKMGEKDTKPKKERGAIDPELMKKYLDMGR